LQTTTAFAENENHFPQWKLIQTGSRKLVLIIPCPAIIFYFILFRAVRCGAPTTSSLLEEVTDVNDLDIKATDNFERNAFHHAVAKPDTLKILLEKLPEIVSFVHFFKFGGAYMEAGQPWVLKLSNVAIMPRGMKYSEGVAQGIFHSEG
jgi:hypothetical protein